MRLRFRSAGTLLALVFAALPAHATWTPGPQGGCTYSVDGATLARGPTAMLNAPLVPFRALAGGVVYAGERVPNRWPGVVLLPPLLVVSAGGMGLAQMLAWFGTGLFDTVTAGYFEAAPPEATRLAIDPLPPLFSDTPKAKAAAAGPCAHAWQ
ncbi:MAG TPA: hypothetical protein VFD84_03370 [Candidatus Binatia bacterium]|jgi:hypothetical protein|nr:hypothetical protein [Candidatus Binatia bacterium]